MRKLTAYLLKALLLALVFVTLAVTAAIWLTQSLRYVDVVVENGAPLHMFAWLALLTLPTFLAMTIPIALFVAVLFTYNRFTQDSELIAMRACGLSPRTLAKPALILGGGAVLVVYFISLWLQPMANQELIRMQYFVQSQFSAALLKEGTFNDLGNRMTVYVAQRDKNAELTGILIHDGRDPHNPVTIRAARGQLVQSDAGPQVVVYDGIQQDYDKKTRHVNNLTFERYAVSLDTIAPSMAGRIPMPREIATFDLIAKIREGAADATMQGRRISELHQRIVSPLLSLSFTFVATACLLLGGYSRRGQVGKVVMAIGLAVAIEAIVLGLGQGVGRYRIMLIPLYGAVIIPIIVGFFLLRNQGKRGF